MKWLAIAIFTILFGLGNRALATTNNQQLPSPQPSPTGRGRQTNNQNKTCPADLDTLTSLLLKDLPSYANRVIQRSRRIARAVDTFSYVIIAGRANFEPLALHEIQYTPILPDTTKQIFFTTLERQYLNNQIVESQNYHWLFLTQTPSGWRMVMVFSRLGSSAKGDVILPPQDTSNSIIGQSVSLWLRDCRYWDEG
jgi:hypothetical protein